MSDQKKLTSEAERLLDKYHGSAELLKRLAEFNKDVQNRPHPRNVELAKFWLLSKMLIKRLADTEMDRLLLSDAELMDIFEDEILTFATMEAALSEKLKASTGVL